MKWELEERSFHYASYKTSKYFNDDLYVVSIYVQKDLKVDRFWVAVSSGRKRKHLEVFEEKDYKSKGGE